MTAWLSEVLKISVRTSVSCSAQSFSTRPARYVTFTFMHLADAFIQSDLQCIQTIDLLSVSVFKN